MVSVVFSSCTLDLRTTESQLFAFDSISILFLDSLKMHNKLKVAKLIRTWLNFEWDRKMEHNEGVECPFSTETMKLITPKGKSHVLAYLSLQHYTSMFLMLSQFQTRRMAVIAESSSAGTSTTFTLCGTKSFLA